MTDKTKVSDFKNKRGGDHSHIKGWGIDADPKNDPTYPMKNRTDVEIEGYTWERPPQQPQKIEVLHSIERPNVTAVFGTSAPPSGLSGRIRRKAFEYGESSYARWLPLILADRINMIEGLIDDVKRGYWPNIFKERGWDAEMKYNRKNFLLKVGAVGAVAGLTLTFFLKKRNRSSEKISFERR